VLLVLGFCVPIALYAGWQDSPTVDEVKATIGWGAGSGDVTDSVTGVVNGSDFDADRWDPDSFAWMAAVTDGADVGQDGLTRHDPAGDVVVGYSGWGTIPLGWLFAGTAVALIAALGLYRARRSGMRAVCALPAALPVAVFTGAVIGDEASWHSLPLAIVLVPAAGALAVTAILRGTRSPAADRPQVDLVDEAAVEDFAERYGEPAFAPIVVVIAAYNESTGLPRVLDTLATSVCGLDVDVVVVDDGSTDETAAVVRGHPRAYLASCRTNRGQGAALRLGYRLARTHGARFIITTDADGQYDAADFPAVLGPVVAGDADLVTGSRRLGHQHTYDRLRRLGVHVFGWLVSCLVGQYHTDTSFGLRAMRAELTEDVTLNQPQYQSAELLIGAHSHGWRVLEVPATMHVRAAGSTKKGRNLVYGTRYARVAVGTWWREGCPRPVSDEAPALQPLRVVRRRARVPRPAQTDRTAV
jgi:hypothetical protein